MTRLAAFPVCACAIAAGAAAAVACVDLTPVQFSADAAPSPVDASPDVGPSGDAAGDGGADAPGTCLACLVTPDDAAPPGCAGEVATCLANAACSTVYACAVANHCFEQGRFQDIVSCGLPCIESAMIISQSDPAIADIYAIAVCAQASCNGPCHIGDAAIPGG
jgi:hypothetical protein